MTENFFDSDESQVVVTQGDLRSDVIAPVAYFEPLDAEQARQLTDTIRGTSEVMYVLISRAHAGRAWEALNYSSWGNYVKGEFNMTRSRSYQILDQARVIEAIEMALPEGTSLNISEATARDLKGSLDDILPELREQTAGLSPADARISAEDILEQKRADLRDGVVGAGDGVKNDGLDVPGAGSGLDEDIFGPEDYMDEPAPVVKAPLIPVSEPVVETNPVDVNRIRRNVNAAHDIYSSLVALSGLPEDLPEILEIIPAERQAQITQNLGLAQNKLNRFAELWAAHIDSISSEESTSLEA